MALSLERDNAEKSNLTLSRDIESLEMERRMRFKLLRKIHHIAKSRIASSKPERVLELITGLTDRFAGWDSGSEDDWAVSRGDIV